jgi:hypothetical protein
MIEQQAFLERERDAVVAPRHKPLKEGLARHLAHIEQEVGRIQVRLGQIELDVRRTQSERQPLAWQADLGLWLYVGLLAVLMFAASLLPWIWP